MKVLMIFMHGSGGDGRELSTYFDIYPLMFEKTLQTFREHAKSHDIDIVTPSAPSRPYSPALGACMNVWYDRSPTFPACGMDDIDDTVGINAVWKNIAKYMTESEFDYFIIGGHSMGGGMALNCLQHLSTLPSTKKVIGIFSMGSFLCNSSSVLKSVLPECPVLMMHGTADPLIRLEWGRATASNLLLKDIPIQFKEYDDVEHTIDEEMLSDLLYWSLDIIYSYKKSIGVDVLADFQEMKVSFVYYYYFLNECIIFFIHTFVYMYTGI